jgi:dephospho-CoA kinase
MRVIGLTGGVATGKSTVARLLRERHRVDVIDADRVARDVLATGTEGLAALVARLGPEIVGADGALDRAAMRARIASDPEARRALDEVSHPRIRAAIAAALEVSAAAGARAAFVEAALLVETGSFRAYPDLWVVTCAPEEQLRRLVERDGMAEADARRFIATQAPLRRKEAVATRIIRTDGPMALLPGLVAEAVAALDLPAA